VDPRAGLDDFEKRKFLNLSGVELRPFGRPARSQSLYRLRYLEASTVQRTVCLFSAKDVAFGTENLANAALALLHM
jgi:hypothetical protein